MSITETVRQYPAPEPTPNIRIDFSPHKEAYTYNVGEESYAPANTFYGKTGEVITFTATVTFAGSNQLAVGYEWFFGDGATGATNPATHTYTLTSEMPVTLIITDNRGVKWRAYKTMYLK